MEESVDRIIYESESFSTLAFKKMAEFRNREEFTDIILVAGCKEIPAHKVIISSLCDYFSAMFRNELSESRQHVVTINNVDPDALEALINYAYTSRIEIRVDNVENILASACLLQVNDVRNACCTFMKSQLHPSNCLGIRAFADAHGCEQLFDIANNYAKDNFADVARNQEFLLLNSEQLIEILQSNDLNVLKEEDVFHALYLWVNHNLDSRKNQLHKILPSVRMPLLSPQFLIDEIEPMIKNDEKSKDLFIETMKYHLLPDRSLRNSLLNSKARKGTIGVLYAVGGNIQFIYVVCVLYF